MMHLKIPCSAIFLLCLVMCFCESILYSKVQFDAKSSAIYFVDENSLFKVGNSGLRGWQDASIQRKISQFGNYNLLTLDKDNDNTITYAETTPDEFVYSDFVLTDSSVLHITQDTVFNLYNKTMQLGTDAQIVVDTNVTLTIRNATIQYRSSDPSFLPPIKLASMGSKLAFDNVTINLINDFHFLQGQLFIHNNVNMLGSAGFVYNSPWASFIASGAQLYFDTGTTFSVAATQPSLDGNFIKMMDRTSQLYLNGCSLVTTVTGCRFTKGLITFANAVSLNSNSSVKLESVNNTARLPFGTGSDKTYALAWSPDGKFLAVANGGPDAVDQNYIYPFDGTSFGVGIPFGTGADATSALAWSPDGKFLAMGNSESYPSYIYPFDGSSVGAGIPILLGLAYIRINALAWSPDGKFLATGANASQNYLYPFNGIALGTPITFGSWRTAALAWSPDGKFLAEGNLSSDPNKLYPFDGTSFGTGITFGGSWTYALAWRPDGKYLAVGCHMYQNNIYPFDGTSLGTGIPFGLASAPTHGLAWSPDGLFLSEGNAWGQCYIYPFGGSIGTPFTLGFVDDYTWALAWHPDGKRIAQGNRNDIAGAQNYLYTFNYSNETNPQALSRAIVFGDSAKGIDYDVDLNVLSGAQMQVKKGSVVYDCVR
jgi:WD40 repeat protein